MSYFKRVNDFREGVKQQKNTFGQRGWDTGLESLDEIFSIKRGYSTVVFSYAHQGKTQLVIDNCIYLAREYGVVSAMYLTEAGKKEEATLDIITTLVGKCIDNITDEELEIALDFIDKYIWFADVASGLKSIVEIYQEVELLINSGVNVQNLVIDHFHQLNEAPEQKYMDRADKTKFVLRTLNKRSQDLNIHSFILFHVRDTNAVICPTSKLHFLPKPEAHELSGGQQSHYLAYNMVSVWRPVTSSEKYGIVDYNGVPYEINQTVVTVAKVKPKGSAVLGSRSIYFDKDSQRFYSIKGSKKIYAVDKLSKQPQKKKEKPSAIKPNLKSWELPSDSPF